MYALRYAGGEQEGMTHGERTGRVSLNCVIVTGISLTLLLTLGMGAVSHKSSKAKNCSRTRGHNTREGRIFSLTD